MKFCVICPHYEYIHRGTENMTRDINKILKKHGHETKVISIGTTNTLRKDKGLGKFSSTLEQKTQVGGFLRKYLGITSNIEDIVFTWKAYPIIETLSDDYDLLWSNGEFWCANMLTKLKRKKNKPILIFFGGGISKMMQKEAEMLPDIFVVLTPTMEEWVKKRVPKCNVKCIPSGVDLKLFNKTKPLFKDKFEHPIVVSTSALIEGKRVDMIVDAMHKLGKGTLFVTSNGPLRDKIVAKGEQLMGDRFKYLGVIPFEDLPKLYSMADVFVLGSRNEAYGAVIFEAMACGCPVVAQYDKTRKWMIGDKGVLVPPNKGLQSWASAIELAWKKNIKNTREQAEKFSWEKTVEGYENAIKEVLDGRKNN